ncbi:MAG: PKD domain-containing protein [Methanosarcina barkeri]|nr:PKD domain-containing protein [Methanosarcina sp. ERenArc_MAG2]
MKTPVACFSAKPTTGKAGIAVQFTDKSTNSSTSWHWDFGDGTTSTARIFHTSTIKLENTQCLGL